MKVEMLATAASPEGILHAGQVYDLPKKKAEAYINPGPGKRAYARPVERGTPAAEISRPPSPETWGEDE